MQGKTGRLLIAALALGIAGCVSSDRTAKVEAGIAKVICVKGMARYSTDNREWHNPAEKAAQFGAETTIQTGPKSFVDLCLNDGHPGFPQDGSEKTSDHLIRIFENSALRIDHLIREQFGKRFSENIELDLRAGEIMVSVGKLFPESSYKIIMPDERVEVREGEFMVGGGVIDVLKGSVSAVRKNADGSETRIEIGSHESYDPSTGKVTPFRIENSEFPIWPSPAYAPRPVSGLPADSGIPHGLGMGGALRKFQ